MAAYFGRKRAPKSGRFGVPIARPFWWQMDTKKWPFWGTNREAILVAKGDQKVPVWGHQLRGHPGRKRAPKSGRFGAPISKPFWSQKGTKKRPLWGTNFEVVLVEKRYKILVPKNVRKNGHIILDAVGHCWVQIENEIESNIFVYFLCHIFKRISVRLSKLYVYFFLHFFGGAIFVQILVRFGAKFRGLLVPFLVQILNQFGTKFRGLLVPFLVQILDPFGATIARPF
jgi:hypothetical protein